MYATVRTYSGGPELADALVSHEADVKSLVSGIDGFNARHPRFGLPQSLRYCLPASTKIPNGEGKK
jgi:hypothetical protein